MSECLEIIPAHVDVSIWKNVTAENLNRIYLIPAVCDLLKSASPNKHVLDIGCGVGQWCKVAAEYGAKQVEGFDVQEDMVEAAKQINVATDAVRIRVGDFHKMPYDDSAFDLAIGLFVLCYCAANESVHKFFQELYRVLAPGGKAAIANHSPVGFRTLYLKDGVDQFAIEEKIEGVLASLPKHPTKEQINDAIDAGCPELTQACFTEDENNTVVFIGKRKLVNSQPVWVKKPSYTFMNHYYDEGFIIDCIKAAGLRLDEVENFYTEERRRAFNNANPEAKSSDIYIKNPPGLMYHISKPVV